MAGFLDLATKAFDCVHHNILLEKLAGYGVVNASQTCNWFQSYLSIINQMQSVKYSGTYCFLFTCINDLPTVVKNSQIHMFILYCIVVALI